MSEDRLTLHGATMAWHPEERLFRASYAPLARPRPDEAAIMQRWMEERVGEGAFDLLVDLRNTDKLSIAWRYRWMSWFYARRARIRIAVHPTGAVAQTIIDAYSLSTRTRIRTYDTEAEAQAWLRESPPQAF